MLITGTRYSSTFFPKMDQKQAQRRLEECINYSFQWQPYPEDVTRTQVVLRVPRTRNINGMTSDLYKNHWKIKKDVERIPWNKYYFFSERRLNLHIITARRSAYGWNYVQTASHVGKISWHCFEQRLNSCQNSFLKLTKHRHSNQKPDCSIFPPLLSPFAICLLCFLLIDTLLPSGTCMLTICSYLSLCVSTVREYIHTHTESIPNCCTITISFMLQKIIFTKFFPFALALWILKHRRSPLTANKTE